MAQHQRSITDFLTPSRSRASVGAAALLRLPHHTKSLWNFAYTRLFAISIGQLRSWEDVFEILCDLAVESRQVERRSDLYLESLRDLSLREDSEKYLQICLKTAQWAIEAPRLFPESFVFPIFKQRETSNLTLSREQIRCLLALMLWCVFPRQEREHNLPRDYTFYKVLGPAKGKRDQQIAKLMCLFAYFESVEQLNPLECVSFSRSYMTDRVVWPECTERLSTLFIDESKDLVETKDRMIKVDFANSYFGGGVLGFGTVQEECMLLAYVEPIVGVLFIEQLGDKDAVHIQGARVVNRYSGYQSEFRWEATVDPPIVLDSQGRNDDTIAVIDAINFDGRELEQYYGHWIERELNKALQGFKAQDVEGKRPVATGNWGCGAFRGDPQLKFLIQWIAASVCGRPMYYITWEIPELQRLSEVHGRLSNRSTGEVVRVLLQYRSHRDKSLFEFVLGRLC